MRVFSRRLPRFCRIARACPSGQHNFHIRRADGTTAAERFLGWTQPALFEQLLLRVTLPPRLRRRRPRPPKPPYNAGRGLRAVAGTMNRAG
ncbi:DUF6399 domain-containing protein [Thiocapsa marina]|uniref:DUF6399 domain-containing protein n=1 Tax=Thiocapsa marina TaxID=244573 RepID=UPI001F2F8C64|nr:DUF6399 domain-containing protein [Thiocapsa marina]